MGLHIIESAMHMLGGQLSEEFALPNQAGADTELLETRRYLGIILGGMILSGISLSEVFDYYHYPELSVFATDNLDASKIEAHMHGNNDGPVTKGDMVSTVVFEKYMERYFPGVTINGEEHYKVGSDTMIALFDPLDSTSSYMIGLPGPVSIACGLYTKNIEGKYILRCSAMYDPIRNVLWAAGKGLGVRRFSYDTRSGEWKLQKTKLATITNKVNTSYILVDAVAYNESNGYIDPNKSFNGLLIEILNKTGFQIQPVPGSARKFGLLADGSAVLTLREQQVTADGKDDNHKPDWRDAATLSLFATEQGGAATTFHNETLTMTDDFSYHGGGYAIGNKDAHAIALEAYRLMQQAIAMTDEAITIQDYGKVRSILATEISNRLKSKFHLE